MIRDIVLQDLEFEQVPITCLSSQGFSYRRWLRIGMPKIPQPVLECVFYLYKDADDARAGKNAGGTGFIVGVHRDGVNYYYGVTNWHVACRDGFSVVRLNRKDGNVDTLEYGPDEWEFIPGRHDVAVIELSIDPSIHKTVCIGEHIFATHQQVRDGYISVGDDAFMLGMFVDHVGYEKVSRKYDSATSVCCPITKPPSSNRPVMWVKAILLICILEVDFQARRCLYIEPLEAI